MIEGVRVITLEEHFATPDFSRGEGGAFRPEFAEQVASRIADVESHRLPEMDRFGVDVQVLSLTTPGVQGVREPDEAVASARRSNDDIADVIRRHPDRFAGLAAIPTQDVSASVDELRRSVLDLGLRGVMLNGQTNGRYLDDPEFEPLWDEIDRLGVPVYLHPAFPATAWSTLRGHDDLAGPVWGWGFETASQVLRLIASGTLDRHPTASIIVGHMGEGLPFALDRIDDRWAILQHDVVLELAPSEYVKRNVFITTAGVEASAPLQCAQEVLGIERMMFSVDYPYQSMESATRFLRSADLSPEERRLLSGETARRVLQLS